MEIWFYRDNTVNLRLHDDMSGFGDLCLPPVKHASPISVYVYYICKYKQTKRDNSQIRPQSMFCFPSLILFGMDSFY